MQKNPGQMPRWKVLQFAITAMAACIMLLTSKDWKELYETGRVVLEILMGG